MGATVRIDDAAVDYTFADLWKRRVADVEIDGVHVAIRGKSLDDFSKPNTGGKAVKAGPGSRPWQVDRFSVAGGKADVDIAPPEARFARGAIELKQTTDRRNPSEGFGE